MDSSVNANLTNTGVLRASSGGTLRLRPFGPGMVFNSGGVIEALNGSTVRVINGITVEGGTVTSSGTGAIRGDVVGGSGGTLSNVTNTGTVAIANGESLRLAGTFTNNGLVQTGFNRQCRTAAAAGQYDCSRTGSILMGNNSNNQIGGDGTPGHTLTVGPGAIIQGGGRFSGNNDNFNPRSIKLVNQGLIESTFGMTLFVGPTASSGVTNTSVLLREQWFHPHVHKFWTGDGHQHRRRDRSARHLLRAGGKSGHDRRRHRSLPAALVRSAETLRAAAVARFPMSLIPA